MKTNWNALAGASAEEEGVAGQEMTATAPTGAKPTMKRMMGTWRRRVLAGLVVASLGTAGTASANIILIDGNNPQPGQENVLFNGPGTISGPALTVTGRTNKTDTLVAFQSDEDLVTPASGQARVTADDGDFTDLSIFLLDGGKFKSLIFNLNADENGSATITVQQLKGPDSVFNVALDGNGENFFTLVAENLEFMTHVNVMSAVEIDDARQFRIAAVPEPSVLLLMAGGLLGLARVRRTRPA